MIHFPQLDSLLSQEVMRLWRILSPGLAATLFEKRGLTRNALRAIYKNVAKRHSSQTSEAMFAFYSLYVCKMFRAQRSAPRSAALVDGGLL